MPHVEISEKRDGRVEIDTNYVDRFLIKELPGANYDGTSWHAPCTWATCVILRGLFGDDLSIGPNLHAWAWNEYKTRVEPAMKLRLAVEIPEEFMDTPAAKVITSWRGTRVKDLRKFQEAGVLYLYYAISAGLLDPMGSGKTTQGIHLLRLLHDLGEDPYPTLVVAPNTVKAVWRDEFELWNPEVKVVIVSGHAGERRRLLAEPADVYVVNWESLRAHSRLEKYGSYALSEAEKTPKELNLINWHVVLADEAHRAKDPKSKQTRALWAVSRQSPRSLWMTGTPFDSHLGELWSPLHYMAPHEWPAKTRYLDRFTETSFNMWGGMEVLGIKAENREEFFKILDPRIRRLPKSVILPELPPLCYLPHRLVDMSAKQAKAYRQMVDHMMTELDDGSLLTASNPLTRQTRLLQFASAYSELVDDNVRMTMPSNKVEFTADTIEELETEQLVFFAVSPQLITLIEDRLTKMKVSYGLVVSSMSVDERANSTKRFQAGDFQVMLATTGVGGEGITLTASSILIRLQRSWKNIHNLQTVDRVHRIGSEIHEQVRILDAISTGTAEVAQMPVLAGKFGRLQEVVRDRETMIAIMRGELPSELARAS